jgi:hypothetical protein
MTFFTEAKADGHINDKIEMSEQELKMMILGMIEDSSVWNLHKNKHKDAHIAPSFKEDLSEFETQVNKHSNSRSKFEEPNEIQYDAKRKMFKGACNCGAEFEIDIKNDKVEQSNDPALRMKELNPYNKNKDENAYGRTNNENSSDYDNKPSRQPAISYNSNPERGTSYKN